MGSAGDSFSHVTPPFPWQPTSTPGYIQGLEYVLRKLDPTAVSAPPTPTPAATPKEAPKEEAQEEKDGGKGKGKDKGKDKKGKPSKK
jgi:hypothetical protein